MSDTHDWKDDPRLVAYALEEWSELSETDLAEIRGALGVAGTDGTGAEPLCQEALAEIQALIPDIERALRSEGDRQAGGAQIGVEAASGKESALAVGGGTVIDGTLTPFGGKESHSEGRGPSEKQGAPAGPRLAGEARAQIALAARRGAPSAGWGGPAMAAAALALVAGGFAWKVSAGPTGPSLDDTLQGELARAEGSVESAAELAPGGTLDGASHRTFSRSGLGPEVDTASQGDWQGAPGSPAPDKQSRDRLSGGRSSNSSTPVDGSSSNPTGGLVARKADGARAFDIRGQDQERHLGQPASAAEVEDEAAALGLTETQKSVTVRNQAPSPSAAPRVASKVVPEVAPKITPSVKAVEKGALKKRSARGRVAPQSELFSEGAVSGEPSRKSIAGREDQRVGGVDPRAELIQERIRESKSKLESPLEEAAESGSSEDLDAMGGLRIQRGMALEPPLPENPFINVSADPFSTFSIDVDTASYTSARASIAGGSPPPKRSVRVEEFINYFSYGDKGPKPGDARPFAVHVDTGAAPWAPDHRLVRIGLKARSMDFAERKRSSLVFLVDISGSMRKVNKLPLVKKALGILTESLHPEDRVAIAVYASGKGLALDSTPVAAREAILQSLERLEGGGSTDGGTGIRLAYSVAREHFIEGGVNRVVLCTDGDFNFGITGEGELEKLIAQEAQSGVELTVLGFGSGSVSGDGRMEALSNRGNGNYAMIDSELEARKVLATEVGGTLLTVAKDVKIQVAWNPKTVGAFRLIGYENRMLTHAQFLDDKKDAGEIGAGHGVTALYEVIPAGRLDLMARLTTLDEDALPFDTPGQPEQDTGADVGLVGSAGSAKEPLPRMYEGDGLVEVRVRYKQPGSRESVGFAVEAIDGGAGFNGAAEDLRFAASVAAFAMMLRGSESVSELSFNDIRSWSLESKGTDPGGLREGFIRMVEGMIDWGKDK